MLENKFFTLTADHIKLLQRMFVGWQDCEFGAPEIDPKRPYGDSDVLEDIGEILGVSGMADGFEYSGRQLSEFERLHKETQTALQIVLSTGSFQPGRYKSDWFGKEWQLVE